MLIYFLMIDCWKLLPVIFINYLLEIFKCGME
uniref:Uncharacterized protein n=1 Tax=Rhizophora mucronata TaxID=61149 RepID=A0A2P2QEB7_RHIMU